MGLYSSQSYYRITKLPDLSLAKYNSAEISGVDDLIHQQVMLYRQMNRRGLLFGETYRLIILYHPKSLPGQRMHIWLEVSEVQNADLSLECQLMASPLADYYGISKVVHSGDASIQNQSLASTLESEWDEDFSVINNLSETAWLVKQSGKRSAFNSSSDGYYIVDEWKTNERARLISLYRLIKQIANDKKFQHQPCCYIVALKPCDYSQKMRADFEFQMQWIRSHINSLDRGNRDDNAEDALRLYAKWLESIRSNPHFICEISAKSSSMSLSKTLLDTAASEAIEEGGYTISERYESEDSQAPIGMQYWRNVFLLKEIIPFIVIPAVYARESIEIPKESAPLYHKNGLHIGRDEYGYDVYLPIDDLQKHALLSGVPGSGKTYSMLHLIYQLATSDQEIPFLVLEPAKKEYRVIARNTHKKLADVSIFSPGGIGRFPLRINPFEFPMGIPLSEHMTSLMQVFQGTFNLEGPFPMLLLEGIEEAYREMGWFPDDINDGTRHYPTMHMLYNQLEAVLENKYAAEQKHNLQSILEVRIGSLIRQEMGNVFDVPFSTIQPDEWINRKCIIELEALGHDGANFLTLMLCMLIREHLRHNPGSNHLRHVIFIEEAHNLIGPSTEQKEDRGNAKTASTQFIVDMLAEVRALGEGIVIADQLPTALAEQVTKNTAFKIAHKLIAEDDREILGNTMSMDAEQIAEMAVLDAGQTFCIYDKVLKPFKLHITNYDSETGCSIAAKEPMSNDELSSLLANRNVYIQDMKQDWKIMVDKLRVNRLKHISDLKSHLNTYVSLEAAQKKSPAPLRVQELNLIAKRITKLLTYVQEDILKISNYILLNHAFACSEKNKVEDIWTGVTESLYKILHKTYSIPSLVEYHQMIASADGTLLDRIFELANNAEKKINALWEDKKG